MDIIYHDFGGTHSVAVASALHLGQLPTDEKPTKQDIQSLPTFDQVSSQELGHLIHQGTDEFDNDVYTVGYKKQSQIALPLIKNTYNLTGNLEELLLVDTKPTINYTMVLGGVLSRRLGLVKLGRPIVTAGVLKAYPKIVELVKDVKNKLKARN